MMHRPSILVIIAMYGIAMVTSVGLVHAQDSTQEASLSAGSAVISPTNVLLDNVSSYENMFRLSYTSFLNCYGQKMHTASCTDKKSADVNEDGVVDEVDYNLILSGFNRVNKEKALASPLPTKPLENNVHRTTSLAVPTGVSHPTATPSPIPSPAVSSVVSNGVAVSKAVAFGGIVSIPTAIVVSTGAAIKKRRQKKKH